MSHSRELCRLQDATWNGFKMNAEAASDIFGADDVYPLSEVRPKAPSHSSQSCLTSLRQFAMIPRVTQSRSDLMPLSRRRWSST